MKVFVVLTRQEYEPNYKFDAVCISREAAEKYIETMCKGWMTLIQSAYIVGDKDVSFS